ncbi:hypothetical protein FHU41_000111 [Psychromicrobium silvestre]|uniref:Uncharacterized protein n=1 Tax=Psychromicrobium silvestre TaxID=1645614 RepID=A0A7Y9S4D6_9MICC|nr:hypothetical protein [Psychromicrobium silvestre]NYE93890.1 hypothetical protein [Psychromicrobium silvestre]
MTNEDAKKPTAGVVEWPEDFYEMLDLIRQRPAMYTGQTSLRALDTWLKGFSFARQVAALPALPHEEHFAGFDRFIQGHYNWRDSGGWVAKIEYYERDGKHALDEFFRLLDLYRLTSSD